MCLRSCSGSGVVVVHFFFSSRRRHTRWTGDWSSDVCSSDLAVGIFAHEDPVRSVAARVEALDPRWVNAMHGGSLTREALPAYLQALREQDFAYCGMLLGRAVEVPAAQY